MLTRPIQSASQLAHRPWLLASARPTLFERNAAHPLRVFSSSTIARSKLQVGDRVLLRWKQGKHSKRKLTKPLREDGETIVDNHTIKHKDIIGQESDTRLLNLSKDGLRKLTVFARHPSLEDFTSLTPRRVAPIYATYASTIVSLLDIHVDPPTPENDPETIHRPSLQILEAGTGHGSLTLQLSRAIAAANPVPERAVRPIPSPSTTYKAGEENEGEVEAKESDDILTWKRRRRAIIHTVDIDPQNRAHADKIIRSFRGALYWPHIDFHTGNVNDWISARLHSTEHKPSLDAVILDMPGVEEYISSVVKAMKEGAHLLVFVPQITQVAACVQEIVTKDLGLKLEKVVELGDGISNGRIWDVRLATLKNTRLSKFTDEEPKSEQGVESDISVDLERPPSKVDPTVASIPPMVCRPMVGEVTRGGGFVGLWKKVSSSNPEVANNLP